MSINWPKPHFNSTSEFQVSGWPFVTSSITVNGSATKISFPQVTQWFQVKVIDTGTGQDIRFGFTQNGVNNSNYYKLSAGATIAANSPIFNVKCTEIWIRGDDISKTVNFSIMAGLTSVQSGDFQTITGSNGYGGVG